ncbi:hypothetical protein, partial [Rubrivirga sp.]|uniref:hypothetical protein n=1 Tax=Rubrivirga sp. TaxID=1885344 RepID=UPI003C77767F
RLAFSPARARIALLVALCVPVGGCGAAKAVYGSPAPVEVTPRQTVVLSIEPTSTSVGHRLYSRLFDLMLDDATRDRVVWPDAPAGGALVSSAPVDLEGDAIRLRVDSLSFSIDGTADRLGVGSVVEGRQFLIARAYFALDPGAEGGGVRSGYAIGQANFNVSDGGVSWGVYLGALTSLASAIVQDARLSRP